MQNGGVQNGGLLNGSAQNGGPALLSSGFRRAEVVRLMQQCLEDLGYSRTAQVLEKDSGIKCLSKPVFRFREAVLGGDWPTAESFIDEFRLSESTSRRQR